MLELQMKSLNFTCQDSFIICRMIHDFLAISFHWKNVNDVIIITGKIWIQYKLLYKGGNVSYIYSRYCSVKHCTTKI